jgi:hypothetical protein
MERNPYLILGVPFGTSREEANAAFVRRARRLRRGDRPAAGLTGLTDLTWALNQIEEALGDPSAALGIYRVPARPEAFAGTGPGLLRPPAEALAARPGDREGALRRAQQDAALECLRQAVVRRGRRIGPVAP